MAENYVHLYEKICSKKKELFSLPPLTIPFKKEKYIVLAN
jgi:hypothetical protein